MPGLALALWAVMKSLLVVLAVAGGEPQAHGGIHTVQSWTDTVARVGEAYCQAELSKDALRQTLTEARLVIDQERAQLTKARQKTLAARAQDAVQAIDRIARALRMDDRAGVCAALSELGAPLVA